MEKQVDRLKELEKIAEKLGIGQNREVKCVSCGLKMKFEDAVILTNKKKVKYLCEECNEKLEQGELEKKSPDISDILKELDKQPKPDPNRMPAPYNPKDWEPVTPKWEPTTPPYIGIDKGVGIDRTTYTVSSMNTMLRLEPNYDNKTDASTK